MSFFRNLHKTINIKYDGEISTMLSINKFILFLIFSHLRIFNKNHNLSNENAFTTISALETFFIYK